MSVPNLAIFSIRRTVLTMTTTTETTQQFGKNLTNNWQKIDKNLTKIEIKKVIKDKKKITKNWKGVINIWQKYSLLTFNH